MSHPNSTDHAYQAPQSSFLSYDAEGRLRNAQPVDESEEGHLMVLTKEAESKRAVALEHGKRDLFAQPLASVEQLPRNYPIRILPVEVMQEIFYHFCDRTILKISKNKWDAIPIMLNHNATKLQMNVPASRLGQVCRAWHSITLSTPSLWATISLSLCSDSIEDAMAHRLISTLDFVLKASGSHELDITFVSLDFDQILHPAFSMLTAECRRWLRVDIWCENPSLFVDGRLDAVKNNVPLLQSLTIRAPKSIDTKSNVFSVAPRHRRTMGQHYWRMTTTRRMCSQVIRKVRIGWFLGR
jgi:hypothetical protein